jgi:hypothetical protein
MAVEERNALSSVELPSEIQLPSPGRGDRK